MNSIYVIFVCVVVEYCIIVGCGNVFMVFVSFFVKFRVSVAFFTMNCLNLLLSVFFVVVGNVVLFLVFMYIYDLNLFLFSV